MIIKPTTDDKYSRVRVRVRIKVRTRVSIRVRVRVWVYLGVTVTARLRMMSVCANILAICIPVFKFHMRMMRSAPPNTIRVRVGVRVLHTVIVNC
jgi:hypothetical protein